MGAGVLEEMEGHNSPITLNFLSLQITPPPALPLNYCGRDGKTSVTK